MVSDAREIRLPGDAMSSCSAAILIVMMMILRVLEMIKMLMLMTR